MGERNGRKGDKRQRGETKEGRGRRQGKIEMDTVHKVTGNVAALLIYHICHLPFLIGRSLLWKSASPARHTPPWSFQSSLLPTPQRWRMRHILASSSMMGSFDSSTCDILFRNMAFFGLFPCSSTVLFIHTSSRGYHAHRTLLESATFNLCHRCQVCSRLAQCQPHHKRKPNPCCSFG